MNIRPSENRDREEIVRIYNQSIPTNKSTADMEPVEVNDRIEWFKEHTPHNYPIFVSETENGITGWLSISPYRPGRKALRYTAEVSYYVDFDYHGQGIASSLLKYAIEYCPKIEIKNLFAILLEHNNTSIKLLEKFGFRKWGFLPRVADFNGNECGQFYYGLHISKD